MQSYTSVNRGTQTDDLPLTATTSVSRASSRSAKESTGVPAVNPWSGSHWDAVPLDTDENEKEEAEKEENKEIEDAKRLIERAEMQIENEESQPIDYEDDFEVHEVSNAITAKQERGAESPVEERPSTADSSSLSSPNFTRARLVTIPKRPTPPALPPRHPHHTWGSGSSRESTSPTALSNSSRSTEPTEAAGDLVDLTESTSEAAALPSNVKKLQTNTVLPAVVDEDDFDDEDLAESDVELPAEKDEEFHSVNGDIEEQEQEQQKDGSTLGSLAGSFQALADGLGSMDIENLDKPELESVSLKSDDKAEVEPKAGAEIESSAEANVEPCLETESLQFEALEAATKKPLERESEDFDCNKSISEDQTHDMANVHALNAQAA